MTKQDIIDKHWLEFIGWSHSMAVNQVGRGGFPYPRNDLLVNPTEFEFWIWFTRYKLSAYPNEANSRANTKPRRARASSEALKEEVPAMDNPIIPPADLKKDIKFLEEMHTNTQRLINGPYDIVTVQHLDKMVEDWLTELRGTE